MPVKGTSTRKISEPSSADAAPSADARLAGAILRLIGNRRVQGAAVLAAAVAVAIVTPPSVDRAVGHGPAGGAVSGSSQSLIAAFKQQHGVVVVRSSAKALFRDFRRIGYRLEDLRKGGRPVPRVFVKAMPKDIRHVESIPTRKAVFIKTLLPLVLRANEELRAIRARVLTLEGISSRGFELAPADRDWLADQYTRFGVDDGDTATLLRRVDVIPPSLALAQGAEESGWGTSRFAIEGRALFGQRTFGQTAGLVPAQRAEGKRFKVRRFEQLLDAVRSYAHNLNTHPAYAAFRRLRGRLRDDGAGAPPLDSLKLVATLESYSARGADYIETIKTIIRANDLQALDRVKLNGSLDDAMALGPAA